MPNVCAPSLRSIVVLRIHFALVYTRKFLRNGSQHSDCNALPWQPLFVQKRYAGFINHAILCKICKILTFFNIIIIILLYYVEVSSLE